MPERMIKWLEDHLQKIIDEYMNEFDTYNADQQDQLIARVRSAASNMMGIAVRLARFADKFEVIAKTKKESSSGQ